MKAPWPSGVEIGNLQEKSTFENGTSASGAGDASRGWLTILLVLAAAGVLLAGGEPPVQAASNNTSHAPTQRTTV